MREDIAASLRPLFERARKEKLIFRCTYEDLIFTPDELEQEQNAGRFHWGAINWELIDPLKEIRRLEKNVLHAQTLLAKMKERLGIL